jgi:hypothetical protein
VPQRIVKRTLVEPCSPNCSCPCVIAEPPCSLFDFTTDRSHLGSNWSVLGRSPSARPVRRYKMDVAFDVADCFPLHFVHVCGRCGERFSLPIDLAQHVMFDCTLGDDSQGLPNPGPGQWSQTLSDGGFESEGRCHEGRREAVQEDGNKGDKVWHGGHDAVQDDNNKGQEVWHEGHAVVQDNGNKGHAAMHGDREAVQDDGRQGHAVGHGGHELVQDNGNKGHAAWHGDREAVQDDGHQGHAVWHGGREAVQDNGNKRTKFDMKGEAMVATKGGSIKAAGDERAIKAMSGRGSIKAMSGRTGSISE